MCVCSHLTDILVIIAHGLHGSDGKKSASVQETEFNLWVRKIPLKREWQLTLVFLPGEFHGQRSLADYNPWDCKESDMSEWLTFSLSLWWLYWGGRQMGPSKGKVVGDTFPMDPNSKMRIAGQLRKKAGFYPDHIFFILKVIRPPWLHMYRKACRPKGDQCQGMFYSDAFLVKSILAKRGGVPIHGRISLPQPDLSLWLGTQALLNPL